MTARSSSPEMERADRIAARVLGSEERIGSLWNVMEADQRRAVLALTPYDFDINFTVSLTWQELETRDRARLVAAFRELLGLSRLVEAALP